jgi:hypothetical protein
LIARASDLVVVEEVDQDVALTKSRRRLDAVREALQRAPRAHVYLDATADAVPRVADSASLKIGGVHVGALIEDDPCVFDVLAAFRVAGSPPACR